MNGSFNLVQQENTNSPRTEKEKGKEETFFYRKTCQGSTKRAGPVHYVMTAIYDYLRRVSR